MACLYRRGTMLLAAAAAAALAAAVACSGGGLPATSGRGAVRRRRGDRRRRTVQAARDGGAGASAGSGMLVTVCGGKCVDTQTDNANCGACGTACAQPTTCQAGACKPVPGAFGGACTKNGDCTSQLCLQSGHCSKKCASASDCPPPRVDLRAAARLPTDVPVHAHRQGSLRRPGQRLRRPGRQRRDLLADGLHLPERRLRLRARKSLRHDLRRQADRREQLRRLREEVRDRGELPGRDLHLPQQRYGLQRRVRGHGHRREQLRDLWKQCAAPTSACIGGKCSCPGGGIVCGGSCVDLQTAVNNAGCAGSTARRAKRGTAGSARVRTAPCCAARHASIPRQTQRTGGAARCERVGSGGRAAQQDGPLGQCRIQLARGYQTRRATTRRHLAWCSTMSPD